MRKLLYMCTHLLFAVVFSTTACAQKKSFVGLNFTVEDASSGLRPGIGGLFEKKLTRHSGLEVGLYYRTYVEKGFVTYSNTSGTWVFPLIISERHLSFPALYKFYSRIINFSAGPTFDFYLGWKHKNKSEEVKVNSYNIDPNLSIGLMGKFSKPITLSKQFFLEPEFRFNPILTFGRSYVGFGIAGKYMLP